MTWAMMLMTLTYLIKITFTPSWEHDFFCEIVAWVWPWCQTIHIAWNEGNPSQHVGHRTNVQRWHLAWCIFTQHWNSLVRHDALWRKVNWVKCVEKYWRPLDVWGRLFFMSTRTYHAWEEKLGLCIPYLAISGQVKVLLHIKEFWSLIIVWKGRDQAHAVLLKTGTS